MNNKIKRLILEYGSKRDFFGPVSEERITQIEKENGIIFPRQYREYVKLLGSGGICGSDLLGIEGERGASVIASSTKAWDNGLDKDFIVIENVDEFDMCMNIKDVSEHSPIYIWKKYSDHPPLLRYDSFDSYTEEAFQEGIANL